MPELLRSKVIVDCYHAAVMDLGVVMRTYLGRCVEAGHLAGLAADRGGHGRFMRLSAGQAENELRSLFPWAAE